tara:strand:+ start:491 stop:802 length:312 start_codon:yes stop_codon:yes gene_type:complete
VRLHIVAGAAPAFLAQFERQWRDYLREVRRSGPWRLCLFAACDAGAARTLAQVISAAPDEQAQGRVGRSLTEQELGDLSDDQKVQILKIAEETTKVNLDKPKE